MKKIIIINLCVITATTGHSQELLWQQCNESLPLAKRIMPVQFMDNNHQEGEDVKATIDDNPSTIYHSAYYPTKIEVTPDSPVELIYDFEDVERIDYMGYAPRQDGGSNGWVSDAEIYVKTEADTDYRLYQHCQWPLNSDVKRVYFANGLLRPVSIKVRFLRGLGNFASCSEMLFMDDVNQKPDIDIFDDELYTTLKPSITNEAIERIENPVYRELASQLKAGTYSTAYRVGTYECYDSPQWLSNQWKTPGKYYDHLQGVTGILVEPGKHMLVVSNLSDSLVARLNVAAWYTGLTGRNFDGGNPQMEAFYLHNGVNIIDYDGPWAGLAYIAYFSEGGAEKNPPIRVHFVGGTVNGYLTPEMTNEQMHEMTATAPSRFIDVVGRKVHAVWTAAGMHEFCKAEDGKSPGYRQYMNILDTLMTWEQRVVGFEKYGRIPRNRTLLYVNFSFRSLFQWTLGISAHVDNERLYLNCRSLLHEESETMWGLGHEWGHQHQLSPNFCWAGVSEVTNNLNAYYNLMHMGYRYEQIHPEKRQGLEDAIKHYIDNETDDCIFEITSLYDKAFERLCPFLKLCNYFTYEGGKTDFLPDLYEALRHSEVTPDSTNIVPYVLNFIRTTSQLSGYNLTPYFDRFGFLRVKSFEIKDNYRQAYYMLTQEQLDAFRSEMSAMVKKKKLKLMPKGMLERIVHTPDIEYQRPHFDN